VTGQHREMLDQVLDFFEVKPDFDLQLMQQGQSLASLTARLIEGIDKVLEQERRTWCWCMAIPPPRWGPVWRRFTARCPSATWKLACVLAIFIRHGRKK
jgi:hypothetical protein